MPIIKFHFVDNQIVCCVFTHSLRLCLSFVHSLAPSLTAVTHTHRPRLTAPFERADISPEKPVTSLKPKNIARCNADSNDTPFHLLLIYFRFACVFHFASTKEWERHGARTPWIIVNLLLVLFLAGAFMCVCVCVRYFCVYTENFINISGTCRNWIFVINTQRQRYHFAKITVCTMAWVGVIAMLSQSKSSLSMNFVHYCFYAG